MQQFIQTQKNGVPWLDTSGNVVVGQTMAVIQSGQFFYMFGVQRSHPARGGFDALKCYRSSNLRDWEFRGDVLIKAQMSDEEFFVCTRPSLIFDQNTGRFVMYLRTFQDMRDGSKPSCEGEFGFTGFGVASSKTPEGPYRYHGRVHTTLGHSGGGTIFKDTDGKGYVVYNNKKDIGSSNVLRIDRLASDYLSIETNVVEFVINREAPNMFKRGDRYFIITSGVTGWKANQTLYSTSTSLFSGWSPWLPMGDETCFDSQPCCTLVVTGSDQTSYLYLGDRHNAENLLASTYVWLPIQFHGPRLSLNYCDFFGIDVSTGNWQADWQS